MLHRRHKNLNSQYNVYKNYASLLPLLATHIPAAA